MGFILKPSSSTVQPAGQAVEPPPTETEPAAGAHLLTAEAQDEIAVAHLLEGQAGIDELEVLVSLAMRIADGCPYGHRTGVKPGECLAESGGETEAGTFA